MTRTLVALASVALLAPTAVDADTVPSPTQTASPATTGFSQTIRASWDRVKRNVAGSADLMRETAYSFKPTPEVRSFGEIVGHLANEHYAFCSSVKREKNPHQDVDFEKLTEKPDLVKAITESIAYCDGAYALLDDTPKSLEPLQAGRRDTRLSVLMLNVTHDSEHYGNLVTYLRMKGFVPPSSSGSNR